MGLHLTSEWNNPETEVALAASSGDRFVGATLGNDVNLCEVEGRSALLLSKAKDIDASYAIGPMIRSFDEGFTHKLGNVVEISTLTPESLTNTVRLSTD